MLNKIASEPDGAEALCFLEGFEDEGVGFVDDGGVEGGEVDLGGGFGVVSHAFADYA